MRAGAQLTIACAGAHSKRFGLIKIEVRESEQEGRLRLKNTWLFLSVAAEHAHSTAAASRRMMKFSPERQANLVFLFSLAQSSGNNQLQRACQLISASTCRMKNVT